MTENKKINEKQFKKLLNVKIPEINEIEINEIEQEIEIEQNNTTNTTNTTNITINKQTLNSSLNSSINLNTSLNISSSSSSSSSIPPTPTNTNQNIQLNSISSSSLSSPSTTTTTNISSLQSLLDSQTPSNNNNNNNNGSVVNIQHQAVMAPKRPRGRPPLSSRSKGNRINSYDNYCIFLILLIDSQSQQEIPTPSTPHQPSKAKVGAVLREASQKILARLMTEDPISISELQNYCQELPPEQTQDILEVSCSIFDFVMNVN